MCTRYARNPLQFSSITAKGDPETGLWPSDSDPAWQSALALASRAAAGMLDDITGGAMLYYAPRSIQTTKQFKWLDGQMVPFPEDWNPAVVTPLCSIGGQLFFK